MDLAKKVAMMRFKFHANMTSIVNAANQLHILTDDKANEMNKHHVMECLDALERLGYDLSNLKK